MINRRLTALLVAVPLAASLAACASSTDGIGRQVGAGSNDAGSSGSASSGSAGSGSAGSGSAGSDSGGANATNAPQLVATMKAALATTSSAKFRLETKVAGQTIEATGAQKLSNGQATDFDLSQKLPTGQQRIIMTGGKTYLQQPGISTDPSKPYVLVSPSSKNPLIRQLATTLKSSQSSASVDGAVKILAAAKSLTKVGATNVNGVAATHYKVVIDFSRVPADYPNAALLKRSGLTDVPLELYVDDKGRPARTMFTLTTQGQTVSIDFTISDYDAPVSISAPPASQVDTD